MIKTAGYTFASRLCSALLSFGLIILVSRWLGPELRGICGLYLVIIALSTALSDIAVGATAAFQLNFYPAPALLAGQMRWGVVPSLLVPVGFAFYAHLSFAEVAILAVACWFNCCWSVLQQILLGFKKFAAFNLLTVLQPAISIGFLYILLILGHKTPESYLFSVGFSFLIAGVTALFCLGEKLKGPFKIPLQETRKIFKKGFQNQLAHLVSLLNGRLIFFMLPAASLGLWSNSLTLAEAFLLIPGSLGQVAYGYMATKTDQGEVNTVFRKAWWLNIPLLLPCLLIAAWIPDIFWQWLFGKEFTGIQVMLNQALPGVGLYSIYLLISYRHSASGFFKYNFYALLAGLSINLLITCLLSIMGTYSLQAGIMALSAGWAGASVANILLLRKQNPGAYRSIISLPFTMKST